MKESEANDGTKLHALAASMLGRVSFVTILAKMEKQSGESWDEMAMALKKSMVSMAFNVPLFDTGDTR